MRVLDVSKYTLVKSGIPCTTTAPVQANTLIQIMQCNDNYIYWFQSGGGDTSSQVSCVNVNGVFYNMPLRLEKAVFRHVRLTRNFQNIEALEDGTIKLRIPTRLLREKKRTSSRLKVISILLHTCDCQCLFVLGSDCIYMPTGPANARENHCQAA